MVPISFISGPAVRLLCRLPSSHTSSILYSGFINSTSIPACSAVSAQADPPAQEYDALRQALPEAHHEFMDVFSKSKGMTLPPRRPYDHKIELEDSATPPFGPIYSLSEVEQLALRQFLDENLANHFICPSQSPSGTPILFIKKKDGSLRLAVDYRGLNRITRKDRCNKTNPIFALLTFFRSFCIPICPPLLSRDPSSLMTSSLIPLSGHVIIAPVSCHPHSCAPVICQSHSYAPVTYLTSFPTPRPTPIHYLSHLSHSTPYSLFLTHAMTHSHSFVSHLTHETLS